MSPQQARPTPDALHHLVIASAARTPNAPALDGPCGTLTYEELDRQANALAHQLADRGVGHGDRVLIWSGKEPAAVAAMQAVLRLGAAYVPVGPSAPPRRVAEIARDCAARLVCATSGLHARVPPEATAFPGSSGSLAVDGSRCAARDDPEPVAAPVAPDDLAYILYTSGSTGTPKGVCISHRNARAFSDWAAAELAARPQDRFANHAPFTFDLSVLDLYAAFTVGATVCPVPAELAYAPGRLVEFLHRERISIWYSVPSVLMLMARDGGLFDQRAPAALRALLFAGEPFPVRPLRQLAHWSGARRLLNLYGPTETNVCTFHEVTPPDLERTCPVPIGKPSCGDAVWARKPDGSRAGPGETGELTVEGPTVFSGYWNDPAQHGPYATGDLARVRADGSYDFLGRADGRLKIRGHRIEPGEVEDALTAHPGVDEAAVVGAGAGLEARLVAFVVPRLNGGARPGVLALKRHLAERLPTHLIPDDIRFLDVLPITARGKTDRTALAKTLTDPIAEEKSP